MLNFKKDRVLLLRVLRDIVTENMGYSDVNPYIDEDVADLITEIKDKRKCRKLKLVRNELDKMIKEMAAEQKLKEVERKFNESKIKEVQYAT